MDWVMYLVVCSGQLRKTAVSLGKDVLRSGVSAGSRALTDIVAGAPVKKSI